MVAAVEIIVDPVPAPEQRPVLVQAVHQVHFVLVPISLEVPGFCLQAPIVVFQSPFVGQTVAHAAVKVPFGAGFIAVEFGFRSPGSCVQLPFPLFPAGLRSCKPHGGHGSQHCQRHCKHFLLH